MAHGVCRSSCVTVCHASQTAGASPENQRTLTGHVAAVYAASFPTFYSVRTHLDRKLIEVCSRCPWMSSLPPSNLVAPLAVAQVSFDSIFLRFVAPPLSSPPRRTTPRRTPPK